MKIKEIFSWYKRSVKRPYLVALIFPLWMAGVIYAIRANPSSDDSYVKLREMSEDYQKLISGERQETIESVERAKFGGALFARAVSWSERSRKFETSLKQLGWRPIGGAPPRFCKNQMLAELNRDAISPNGVAVVYIEMTFNIQSIRACPKASNE